jgi:hypothetical protein
MALRRLFASRRECRRRADEQAREEGVRIKRRLQELLGAVPALTQEIAPPQHAHELNRNQHVPKFRIL